MVSPLLFYQEDQLYRSPQIRFRLQLTVSARHPSPSGIGSTAVLVELVAGTPPQLFSSSAGWLELVARPTGKPLFRSLFQLFFRLLPALSKRDLPFLLRVTGRTGVCVIRHWGELGLPLPYDYFGKLVPVVFELSTPFPRQFLSYFRFHL
jgi:hypothetical protein